MNLSRKHNFALILRFSHLGIFGYYMYARAYVYITFVSFVYSVYVLRYIFG